LARQLRKLLELLHCLLMTLNRGLNRLNRLAFALSQLLQLNRVLLFLFQHLLIHGGRLAGLLFQLSYKLFDLANLLRDIIVHVVCPPKCLDIGNHG